MRKVIAAGGAGSELAAEKGASRREFLVAGGAAAAGAAALVATHGAAPLASGGASVAPALPAARQTEPSTAPPAEPISAFVRDADRGEVTLMAGHKEVTYNDPALVKRLLDAAP